MKGKAHVSTMDISAVALFMPMPECPSHVPVSCSCVQSHPHPGRIAAAIPLTTLILEFPSFFH